MRDHQLIGISLADARNARWFASGAVRHVVSMLVRSTKIRPTRPGGLLKGGNP